VLSFNEDSFTASGVYGLAENKWIKQAFGFQDLDMIKEAIDVANIRRTYCGEKEDESCYSSWQFGLKRLIYGYCLGNQEDIIDPEDREETILPVDFFEGEKAQDLFRLNRMVEMLHDFINVKSEVKNTNDWEAFCLQIAENFLCPESWQLKKLKELLEGTGTKNPDSEFQIGFAAWFFRFRELLEEEGVSRISGNAGILFTGLYPGNALPKKVVAFLAMNFRQFPRKRIELDFDRTQTNIEEPSLKKFSRSDWERYVFLKIFQSAGEQVLFSYIGQNAKNNAEIPASGVVDQVLDYAGHYTTEDLIVKHKLHAHSTIYYQNKKHYFSYLAHAKKADLPKKQKIAEEVVTETTDVFLFELEQFYKNPIKHYYNKTLGIYYKKEDSLRDTELFGLGNLEKWSMKSRLFEEESQLRDGNSDLTET